MAVLIDSGFLFASLNASESEHQATIRVLENIREPIVLPVPAITEVAYLLARDINNEAAADFIASLATTELTLEVPRQEDYARSAEILRQYADAKLDFVDTLIVAIAERLNITRVLTLDRRDFPLIRPSIAAVLTFCRNRLLDRCRRALEALLSNPFCTQLANRHPIHPRSMNLDGPLEDVCGCR